MLRRFLKDSVSQLHRDVAMDAIPGLAEEMMDARIGRRHVKVRGEWNRSPNQFPHGRGPLSSACDIIIASRAPRLRLMRARGPPSRSYAWPAWGSASGRRARATT